MIRIATILKRTLLIVAGAGFGLIAAALVLYLVLSGDGRTLQVWHTARLTEEFTAARQDTVRSFEDYRRLEQRLFAQLDATVYARTATGPAYALVRYSRGSMADPARRATDWNHSFELPADTPAGGVLLLHGMSDSPYSLRALGEALHRRGYWVLGLRMPGHGTAPSGMTTVTWEDMAAAVRLGVNHLAAKVGPAPGLAAVHIIGYSTGAPLALDYTLGALERPGPPVPASLVLVSPAIGVTPAAALAKWKHRLSRLPGLETLAWTQILPEFDPFKYNSFTSNAADQVHRMTRSVARRIDERAAAGANGGFPPVLVFLSAADATVSTDAVVDTLLNPLAGARNELVLFDVNRRSVSSTVMIADPGPLTARLMASPALPFALTLLANESPRQCGGGRSPQGVLIG